MFLPQEEKNAIRCHYFGHEKKIEFGEGKASEKSGNGACLKAGNPVNWERNPKLLYCLLITQI